MWCNINENGLDEETTTNWLCTSTLFNVRNDEPEVEVPNVICEVENDNIIMAIDKTLLMIKAGSSISDSGMAVFEDNIDCIHYGKHQENLIICGLRDGSIHGLHIMGTELFQIFIEEQDVGRDGLKTFVGIKLLNDDYYLMCSNGTLYRLCDIDANVNDSQLNGSLSGNCTIIDNVKVEKIFNKHLPTITTFDIVKNYSYETCIFGYNDFLMIAASNGTLYFRTTDETTHIRLPLSIGNIKKLISFEHIILALSEAGKLFKICPNAKLLHPICGDLKDLFIEDILVQEGVDEALELLLLTKLDYDGRVYIKTIDYLTKSTVIDFLVKEPSWLVNQSKNTVNTYYVEGKQVDSLMLNEINFMSMTETQPDQRIKKLIHKGHFDEAETLCKQFKFSMQPIYEAKARRIFMAMESMLNNLDEIFMELLEILNLIENEDFFIQIRYMEIPHRGLMATYLKFILLKLSANNITDCSEINEQLLRLETLNLIDPYETKLDWYNFIGATDLIKVCCDYFKTDIAAASLIWHRHQSSIKDALTTEKVQFVLEQFPNNTEISNILYWLQYFVPTIIIHLPEAMSMVSEWCKDRIIDLQYSKNWPEIGLEFSQNILSIFSGVNLLFADIQRRYDTNIKELHKIVSGLQDLCVLSYEYSLPLPLDDYLKTSVEDTAFFVIQRIQVNHLRKLVEKFLTAILRERGLTTTNVLIRYVKYLMSRQRASSTWIDRAIICIQLMPNENDRLKLTIEVLKLAPIPWDQQKLKPLTQYWKINHPLALQIKSQIDLEQIKKIKVDHGWSVDSQDNLLKLARRVILLDGPQLLTNIKTIAETCPEHKYVIYHLGAYHLVKKGCLEDALDFIDSINDIDRLAVCELSKNIIARMIDEEPNMDENLIDNSIEYMKMLNKRMGSNLSCWSITYSERLLVLRRRFFLTINREHLEDTKNKEEILTNGINLIIKNICGDNNFADILWNDVQVLCTAIDTEFIIGIMKVAEIMDNLHVTCLLANFILEKIMIKKANAELVINYVILMIVQIMNNNLHGGQGDVTDPLVFPLANRLLNSAYKFCRDQYLKITEFLRWVSLGNSIYESECIENTYWKNKDFITCCTINSLNIHKKTMNGNDTLSNKNRNSLSVFEQAVDTADEEQIKSFDPMPSIKCITLGLMLVLEMLPDDAILKSIFDDHFISIQYTPLEDLKTEFFTSLNQLIKYRHYKSAFYIIIEMKNYENFEGINIFGNEFTQILFKKILKYGISQREPDFLECLSVLLAINKPEEYIDTLLDLLKVSQSKIYCYQLAEMYFKKVGNEKSLILYRERRLQYHYSNELNASIKHTPGSAKINLITHDIKNIISERQIDPDMMEKLCKDSNIDYQSALTSQILLVLQSQQLLFDVKFDQYDNDEIIVKSSLTNIQTAYMPYLSRITNTGYLVNQIRKYLNTINPYFYELYLAIIDILTYINLLPQDMNQWRGILIFLINKMTSRRINRPSQLENDVWLQRQADASVLPKIAKYRFPFNLIVENPLKDVLDNEITVDTCPQWFPLIELYSMLHDNNSPDNVLVSQEYFCMAAIKNCINEYKSVVKETVTDIWHLQPVNNAFLQSVLRLVSHMKTPSKILFALYFVANEAPLGADQVEAFRECYKFIQEHEIELGQIRSTRDMISKVQRRYPVLQTQHLLYLYGLGEDALLSLADNPSILINTLYMHNCILLPHKPNINELVKKICDVNNITFEAVQISYINKFLGLESSNCNGNQLDETFADIMNTSGEIGVVDSDTIVRAHYILSSWDPERAVQLLISNMYTPEGNDIGIADKLNLFECLTKLVDDKTDYHSIVISQEDYLVLKCIFALKTLGYNFTREKFNYYDKVDLITEIWTKYGSNTKGLEVITLICIGYKIFNPRIWNGVLKKMISKQLDIQLENIIDIISSQPELLNQEGVISAWEYLLLQPFSNVTNNCTEEQESNINKALIKLQASPVTSKINVIKLTDKFLRIGRPQYIAVILPLVNSEMRLKLIELVSNNLSKNLKTQILELEEIGIMPTLLSSSIEILKL